MFLIYGMPRSGTTHLCYELDARVSDSMKVLNEPFHCALSLRRSFRSDCDSYTIEGQYDWLMSQKNIAGVKLVSNYDDHKFANNLHHIFDKVVILRRNLIDIAISLQIAYINDYWNHSLSMRRENYISSANVQDSTLNDVKKYYEFLNEFIEIRKQSNMDVIELEYDGNTEVQEAAKFLNLPQQRNCKTYRKIVKMRKTENRSERCHNLDYVIEYLKNELGIEYENN